MRVKYPGPGQLRLLFMDTDSLAYAVQRDDIYIDMAEDAVSRYDFSEYPFDHPLYSATNRKAQFVGLRPKSYAFLCTRRRRQQRVSNIR